MRWIKKLIRLNNITNIKEIKRIFYTFENIWEKKYNKIPNIVESSNSSINM